MNKAEWDAMEARDKDTLIAEMVMGWDQEATWRGFRWRDHETKRIVRGDEIAWSPTADRNACALVLDEIERRGKRVEFLDAFTDEDDQCVAISGERFALWVGMTADQDTICYAALKAVEEDDDED